MTTLSLRASRRCYNALNPLHSAFYFAPEHDEEFAALGLEAGSMAYFAGRAAPMGAVGAGVVTATFYNFSPALVGHHIPRAWQAAAPERVLETRVRITDKYLTRLLGPEVIASRRMAETAELALRATEACERPGRPLYAANADLPAPDAPHLALWHAVTLLREHRGDGHIAALVQAELDGLEALVTHSATGKGFTPHFFQTTRGWTARQWADAEDRLRERGLLDEAGDLTEHGQELRRAIEADTDRLAFAPYRHLGQDAVERLTELVTPFTQEMLSSDALPMDHFGR
ncbi:MULTISPECIES: SCO6745 family protein [Streptomycetaceae]|uniref:SalK n=1 Tax=Streptantibioticus cattleyicolor (strain ATCC 35852 / DSM 46488 / JCM 4925 / NBRC 14057 / NRRL 8057) TaxID=1003195 RepID=F8JZJ2_STREN|nr:MULTISPECIES: hypothetical protein [Streptomycetaceae]AEW97293.1 hypothetical protein SCATT_49220 [Streptantibioticus cattleyicolor NRRL 8057 = DSM 46488]MYS61746.1 hypothetical protein [Streptomyces sp. SID5468]CCB77614.1 conserved protein of unknown function [Streptantibioticus cattleyicolor NRRL 8057 = DSM 46488]